MLLYICVLILVRVSQARATRRATFDRGRGLLYVSSYYYICVLILVYTCVLILVRVSQAGAARRATCDRGRATGKLELGIYLLY